MKFSCQLGQEAVVLSGYYTIFNVKMPRIERRKELQRKCFASSLPLGLCVRSFMKFFAFFALLAVNIEEIACG
jgi:hypothetical protein